MLLSCREEVQDYLHEIYFLPDHPELRDIHTVLQDYKKVCQDKMGTYMLLQWSLLCFEMARMAQMLLLLLCS